MRVFILSWLRGEVLAASMDRVELQGRAETRHRLTHADSFTAEWIEQRGHGPVWTWGDYAIQETDLRVDAPAGWTIIDSRNIVWIHRTFEHADFGRERAEHLARRLTSDHSEIAPFRVIPLYALSGEG